MATISNLNVAIVRDVANADVTVTYTINWSAFDQATNLSYLESWGLTGDDTNQDGDNLPLGDDPIPMGLMFLSSVSSNGAASTPRTKTKTISWASLDEDSSVGNTDDEIRATVTLQPQLPISSTRESTNFVLLTAP